MDVVKTFKFRAFLSYSHADRGWAEKLHTELEAYPIPRSLVGRTTRRGRVPAKLRPIFRDRSDMEAGHSLTQQTIDALENSKCLIVICSPFAAHSAYVNEEIRLFKALGRSDAIYPIIIDGEPGDPDLDCFPSMLRTAFDANGQETGERVEPIAADARDVGDGRELAIQKIIGGMLGVELDDLRQRELVDERRRNRIWMATAGLMLFLAIGSGVGTWLAYTRSQTFQRVLGNTVQGIGVLVQETVQASRERGVPIEETLVVLEQAREMLKNLKEEKPDDARLLSQIAKTHLSFADAYALMGKKASMLDETEKAEVILKELMDADKENPEWKVGYSNALVMLGRHQVIIDKPAPALEHFNKALSLKLAAIDAKPGQLRKASRENLEGLAIVYEVLTKLNSSRGERGKTSEHLAKWKEVTTALVDRAEVDNEGHARAFRRAAEAYYLTADLHRRRNERRDGREAARIGLTFAERLDERSTSPVQAMHIKANFQSVLGDIERDDRNKTEALEHFKVALGLREQLKERDPANVSFRRSFAFAYVKLAEVESSFIEKLPDSLKTFESAAKEYDQLQLEFPGDMKVREGQIHALQGVASVKKRLAFLLREEQDRPKRAALLEDARVALRKRLNTAKFMLERDPSFARQYMVTTAAVELGEFLLAIEDYSEAERRLRDGVKERKKLRDRKATMYNRHLVARTLEWLSTAQLKLGKTDRAIGTLEEALAIRKKLYQEPKAPYRAGRLADVHIQLGEAHASAKNCTEGKEQFELAVHPLNEVIAARPGATHWEKMKAKLQRVSEELAEACAPKPAPAETDSSSGAATTDEAPAATGSGSPEASATSPANATLSGDAATAAPSSGPAN